MVRPSTAAIPSTPPCSRGFPRDSSSPDSPSKNTRSRTQVSESHNTIPVLVSPPKRRKKGEPDDDLAVWDKSDEEIIGVYLIVITTCRSNGLQHLQVTRRSSASSLLAVKEYQQRRDRMATSRGTTNLRHTNEQCCK